MCDYSLTTRSTRPAQEGERLLVHRFPEGSIGLASPADLPPPLNDKPRQQTGWQSLWNGLRSWAGQLSAPLPPAVCISPGTQLMLRNLTEDVRSRYGVGEEELVTFVYLQGSLGRYRDAVRFSNGVDLLLQNLQPGLVIDILQLSPQVNEEGVRDVMADLHRER